MQRSFNPFPELTFTGEHADMPFDQPALRVDQYGERHDAPGVAEAYRAVLFAGRFMVLRKADRYFRQQGEGVIGIFQRDADDLKAAE